MGKIHYPSAMPTNLGGSGPERDKPWKIQPKASNTTNDTQSGGAVKRNVIMIDSDRLAEGAVGEQNFVDSFRSTDFYQVDLKSAVQQAKKEYTGPSYSKKNGVMDEEEFHETGGLVGYVERGRSLLMRKKYKAAKTFLDFAIIQGYRELPTLAKVETPLILDARQLRARCHLAESRFSEALLEAERVLRWQKNHKMAMLIKAEALYANCQFERALMTFYRGSRVRSTLRNTDGLGFDEGIAKSKSAIRKPLSLLDEGAVFPWQPSRPLEERERFKSFISEFFEVNDWTIRPPDTDEFVIDPKTKTILSEKPIKSSLLNPPSMTFTSLASPINIFRAKCRMKREQREKEEQAEAETESSSSSSESEAESVEKEPSGRKKTHGYIRSFKSDKDLARLREDEDFLGALQISFGKEFLECQRQLKRYNGQHQQPLYQRGGHDPAGNYQGNQAVARQKRLVSRGIFNMTNDALEFIDNRKAFWVHQFDRGVRKKPK